MPDILTAARLASAAPRPLFKPTPLERNDPLSARFEADNWLKRKDLTPVRSCKNRADVGNPPESKGCIRRIFLAR